MALRVKEKKYTIKMKPKEAKQLLAFTLRLSEIAEDVLEEHGDYSKEFVSSLKKSLQEARQGRVRKIHSLKELM